MCDSLYLHKYEVKQRRLRHRSSYPVDLQIVFVRSKGLPNVGSHVGVINHDDDDDVQTVEQEVIYHLEGDVDQQD